MTISDHFGVILDEFWFGLGHFGFTLGSLGLFLCVILAPLWGRLVIFIFPFLAVFGPF